MKSVETIAITECPTGVGATFHGLSRGVDSLLSVGIVSKLKDIGYKVETERPFQAVEGSLRFAPTGTGSEDGVRDVQLALQINQAIRSRIKASLSGKSEGDGHSHASPTESVPLQLILGGVCSMCPAIMSAFHESLPNQKVGIVWMDADADLSIPNEYPGCTNILACMAFSHMVNREGALKSMQEFRRHDHPGVSDPSNTAFFGLNTVHQAVVPRTHLSWLMDNNYRVFTSSAISQSVEAARTCAQRAIDHLTANGCETIVVHVDVDVIDGVEFPLGNLPNFTGITFEQFLAAFDVFVQDRRVKGFTLTEMNPDRDTGLVMTKRLVDGVVACFQARALGS